jgi:hypothetical protein
MILNSLSYTSRSAHHSCCFCHGSTHFPSSHIAHATLGYISQCQDSGATFDKKEKKKENRGKSEERERK